MLYYDIVHYTYIYYTMTYYIMSRLRGGQVPEGPGRGHAGLREARGPGPPPQSRP